MSKRSRSKYNWPTIKQVYIAGKLNPETGESEDYTYTELAAMFKVKTDGQVRKRAEKYDWNIARDRQKKTDEDRLKQKLQEMKAAELPDIVEMRKRLLKGQLLIITNGLKKLQDGEMEIKPIDLHRASEFIIQEYHTLFGITPQPPITDTSDEPMIQINIGDIDDLYDRANRIRPRRVV